MKQAFLSRVPKGANLIQYDSRQYEGQMAFFNQVLRPSIYKYADNEKCLDCTSLSTIVYQYLMCIGIEDPYTTGDFEQIHEKCYEIETDLMELVDKWDSMRARSGIASNLHDGEEEDEEKRV
jgi:hypothetical protein